MRSFGVKLAAFVMLVAPASSMASTLAFEDNKLNFRSCDGDNVTARWRDGLFSLSLPGKSLGDAHKAIKFVAWDGSCVTGRWDEAKGEFLLHAEGTETSSGHIRYMTWDGSKWVGMRAGSGFFVARVAAPHESVTSNRLAEMGQWLERRYAEFTPGAALAIALKDAASQ